jgi:hypothetical protein
LRRRWGNGTKSFGSGGATQRRWRAPSNGTSIASTVTCCAWRDPSVAADLFQQTWLNVVRQIGRYDERRSFDTWLFAIGHNAAMDLLRDAPLAVRDNPRYRGKQSYAPCSVWKRIHPTSGMPNSAPEMPEPGMAALKCWTPASPMFYPRFARCVPAPTPASASILCSSPWKLGAHNMQWSLV